MIKLLIGGSPCTYWSIAQSKHRETEPSGIGWELFENYLIAGEKYKPDYFLYENNYSMDYKIREEITKRLGVEPIMINSALVSAQNRKRLYWTNIPDVALPEDRGILLKDILESGEDLTQNEKSYCLTTRINRACARDTLERKQRNMIAEPCCIQEQLHGRKVNEFGNYERRYEARTDNKSGALTTNNRQVSLAEPVCVAQRGRYLESGSRSTKIENSETAQYYEARADGKSNALTTVQKDNSVAEPIIIQRGHGYNNGGVKYSKSPTVTATGSYIHNNLVLTKNSAKSTDKNIYEVKNGLITINDKTYSIKLSDGFYIIRKLTVTECKRLQTVPDDYKMPCSKTQNYKMLGNGWTVDVIAHILSYIPNILNSDVEVLSMYDGMSCGHIALDKLGAKVVRYFATEIDKYAVKTTISNYPETIYLGDAFNVRRDDFKIQRQRCRKINISNCTGEQISIF